MRKGFRRWWPVLKLVLGLTLVVLIGRQFVRDLGGLAHRPHSIHLPWLAFAGVLYLAGIGCSAVFWRRLLAHLGVRPPLGATLRAYYVGHLGKYLPGKAWSLALRAGLVHGHGVRLAVAAFTTLYEVLATMAAGVLLAAVLFGVLGTDGGDSIDLGRLWRVLWQQPEDAAVGRREAVLLSLALFAVTALPLQPLLFNYLARRSSRALGEAVAHAPPVRSAYFLEGLLWTGVGWLFLGASMAATLQGTTGSGAFWAPDILGRLVATMGLSYVIGFVVVVAPAGLGVREFFLKLFLTPELVRVLGQDPATAAGLAALAVLLLRLTWTAAEVAVAAPLYWLPRRSVPSPTASPAGAGAAGPSPGGTP
jgi:hypothetical protein